MLQLRDAAGNAVSQSGVSVSVAIASGGGILGGTTSVSTNASGVATYTNLSITGTAGDRTVSFTSSGLTGVTSGIITVTAGPASQLSITTQPSSSAQNAVAFGQQPVIQLKDAVGNPVNTSGVVVTAAISTGGGTLGGTLTATTNASGVATFTNLSITGTIGDRTLVFTASGFTSVTSSTITVTAGSATQLAITIQPSSSAQSGIAFGQQPVLQLRDVSGNNVSQNGVVVTAAIASGGGTLGGTLTASTNASGVASFSNLSISGTIGNRTLSFSATGLTGATSNTIALTAGSADHLSITQQPSSSAQSGVNFAAQPVLQLRDASNNAVSQSGVAITATIASGPGGATLGGATVVTTDGSGVATYVTLNLSGPSGSYTLGFAGSGLTGATSNSITLSAGTATKLAITTQPSSSAQSGVGFAQQPAIQLQDNAGNPVSQAGVVVTATINSGGGSLGGTTTATTNASGLATFTNLSITGTAGDRTLLFAAAALVSVASNTITVSAGPATQLAITQQPVGGTSGGALGTQPVVAVRDASGNTVTTDNSTQVTIAIFSGAGGSLGGTLAKTVVNGVATFTNVTLSGTVGTNYVLQFTSSPALTAANSNNVTVTPGTATKLTITTQPVGAASGAALATQPVVAVQDAQGNTVTADNTTQVTVAIFSGAGGTLGGTLTKTVVNGVATFTNVTLSGTVGTDYVLQFSSSPALTAANSNNVTVTAGAANKLGITTQPAGGASGAALATQPVIAIQDAQGNTVTSDNSTQVTVAIFSGAGGTLGGTLTVTAVNGIATLTNVTLTGTTGTNYVLRFTSSPVLTAVNSNNLQVTSGSASKLGITTQPVGGASGAALATQPVIAIQDA